eukprot:CAMPEP_0171063236 /NCGR_PEP_ID=MMETSP0766_2-20121228/5526_1 /TAXON_ID=439317 /ORGANISM="Gambierdiscus australes, Strain CAWD 149" /LENGTH=41 /DNA_ID= /DNA_START= /DNA_END= /DNA_ORIENTATION=
MSNNPLKMHGRRIHVSSASAVPSPRGVRKLGPPSLEAHVLL